MILIVDDSCRKRSLILRDKLYESKLPCAVVTSDKLKSCVPARMTVAFAENETQLSIVSIRARATDYIVINDTGRRMINTDAYFYDPQNDGEFCEFVERRFQEKYGMSVRDPMIYPVRFEDRGQFFFNMKVNLTNLEEMIVRFLLFSSGEWRSAEDIARFTMPGDGAKKNASSISVHICNINKKSKLASGRKLILAKRFHGYKINMSHLEKTERGHYRKKIIPPQYT